MTNTNGKKVLIDYNTNIHFILKLRVVYYKDHILSNFNIVLCF